MHRLLFTQTLLLLLTVLTHATQELYQVPGGVAFASYDLHITLHPNDHRLEGTGTMVIPAAEKARDSIQVGLSEQMRDFKVEVLEPKDSAGIAELAQQRVIQRTRERTVAWTITPARPFPASQAIKLRLSWAGGEKGAFVFYLGPEGSFASGVNSAWYPLLESGYGTGVLRVTVPAGYLVHAGGTRHGTPEEMQDGHFRFESRVPSYFAFVAAKYTVIRREGKVPVSIYLMRPRANMDRYIEGSLKTVETLSREFGPYPYGEFAIVEVPEKQAGDAGFSGASAEGFIMAVASFLDQDFNLAYYGHEISHQWWGNLVKFTGQRGSGMLDEAMAQYGSLRAVETLDGSAAAEQYRRTGYPGYYADQSGLGYLAQATLGDDHPLSELKGASNFRLLTNGKGFIVWDMLSRTVGREKFRAILNDFTQAHAFQKVTWEEFLQAVEKGAGRDLQWFYDQWLNRTGVPDWQLNWKQIGSNLYVTITQPAPHYRATLEIEVKGRTNRTREMHTVELTGPRTEFKWKVGFPVQSVGLDPHFMVLRWTPEYHSAAIEEARKLKLQEPPGSRPLAPPEQELLDLERQLTEASIRGDKLTLDRLIAEDFTATKLSSWGQFESKSDWITNAVQSAANIKGATFNFDQTKVRIFHDMALFNSILTLKHSVADKPVESKYLVLDVWVRRNGRWQLTARHLEKSAELPK